MLNNVKKIITASVITAASWMTLSPVPTGSSTVIAEPEESSLPEKELPPNDLISLGEIDNVPGIIEGLEGEDELLRQNKENVQELDQAPSSSTTESSENSFDEIGSHFNDCCDDNGIFRDHDDDISADYNPVGLQHWSDG